MAHAKNTFNIAIVGGGPAGSFTTHFLNKFAAAQNKKISIDIYDYRCFSCGGKNSCNMCAGIIAGPLIDELEKEGFVVPKPVIKNDIDGYQLHSHYNILYLSKREGKKIFSVFRGQGPLKLDGNVNSYDQFLLDKVAENAAVSVINVKVTGLDFFDDNVTVKVAGGLKKKYDFVVGAFGVNTNIADGIHFGYKPPRLITFLQMEVNLPEDFVKEKFRDRVQLFPVYKNNIWFITMTPKANFVTITAVGKNVQLTDVKKEISGNRIYRSYLPHKDPDIKCMCQPKLPVGFAVKPYHHRFLVVGDACVSRYLKNGIQSALRTASIAADTIINHGFTGKIIKRHYFKKIKKIYSSDHRWGKLLYFLKRLLFSSTVYTEAHFLVAKKELITHSRPRFSNVLWAMSTGDEEYREIFKKSLHPGLLASIAREYLLILMKIPFKGKSCMHLPVSRFYKLLNTHRVVIIGGGPAGSACAIKLAREAKKNNLNLDIVLFEGKDFKRHHNQCVGILSPPLIEILKKDLEIEIPADLIKSEINGYELFSDKETIFLENYRQNTAKTYSVRRSEFDHFLLEKAKEHGVKVINSRVVNIEFFKDAYHDEVRIFSESNYVTADIVVCAFGLDREMLSALNQATGNRFKGPAKVMKTFITRFDFSPEELVRLYDRRIYAFLVSSIKKIKFGAITIKDDHIVVNIAGENANSASLQQFLYLNKVHDIMPNVILKDINCYCGRFPSSPSRHPYGDRYVAVGDTTGWLRPLKGKGINVAVITGINAALTMINDGVSRKALEHYRRRCKDFIQDYKYGMLANVGLGILLKLGLLDVVIRLAKKHPHFYNMLYDSVSAEDSYKNILKSFFKKSPQKKSPE